jgi:hypothetical protein
VLTTAVVLVMVCPHEMAALRILSGPTTAQGCSAILLAFFLVDRAPRPVYAQVYSRSE